MQRKRQSRRLSPLLSHAISYTRRGDSMPIDQALAFANTHADRFVDELKDLLRIPSVSTDPTHAADVRRAADIIATELRRIGLENVRLIETHSPTRHPLIYAD